MLYIIYQLFIIPLQGIILREKILTVHWGWGVHTIQLRNNVLFCFREEGTGEKKGERGQSLLSRPYFDSGGLSKKAAAHNPYQLHLRTWPGSADLDFQDGRTMRDV